MQLHYSILDTIGHTPIVRLKKVGVPGIRLYGKLESFNPMGSVKDRMALAVIEAAERSGALGPGQTVIEATSGNTGIGLAMVCARKGYPLVVTMAENFSVERRKLMRFLGARVVLTPAGERGTGMLAKAIELAEKHGWFLCRQFDNEANADAHSRTTAPEILDAFRNQPLDYWVTGYGTGGTLKGVARVLKAASPGTKIIVCEPDNSPLMSSQVPQPRDAAGNASVSHPRFRPHPVQGWSPDFIPRLAEDARQLIDGFITVAGDDALRAARDLAAKEGILAGISGGATLAGAQRLSRALPEGSSVLCMIPDTGERYLSTPLFDGIATEMTDEEMQISRSTPHYRFDTPSSAVPVELSQPLEIGAEVERLIDDLLHDPEHAVIVFALEWCEFSWSTQRMLRRCGIPFKSINLDAAELQENDRGARLRAALHRRTSFSTIPQVFVGGERVGGCTALFDAYRQGRLQTRLDRLGVPYDRESTVDPYSCLPAWLHRR